MYGDDNVQMGGGGDGSRYRENGQIMVTSVMWYLTTMIAIEFCLFLLRSNGINTAERIVTGIGRVDLYVVAFVWFFFVKGLFKLNLTFIEKFGGLSIVGAIYLLIGYIKSGGFSSEGIAGSSKSSDFIYNLLQKFIGSENMLIVIIILIAIFIGYAAVQFKDFLTFLEHSGMLQKIKSFFGLVKEEEQEEEEAPKKKTEAETYLEWINRQFVIAEFARDFEGSRTGAEAIDFQKGLGANIVTVDPKGKDFGALINFCSVTLGEKSSRFDTSATEVVINGKRMIQIMLTKAVSEEEFMSSDYRDKKIQELKRFPLLNTFRSIDNDDIEGFKDNPYTAFFGLVKTTVKPLVTSIVEAPHMLITGETKGGKSVFMHNIIVSLMKKNTPEELQFCILDPKEGVEFGFYETSPYHSKFPFSPGPLEAIAAFGLILKEYSRRKDILLRLKKQSVMQIDEDQRREEGLYLLVIVIDEYADLYNDKQYGKTVNTFVEKFAAKMRFAGIHLILATQNASGVISSTLKSNLPLKVSMRLNDWRAYMNTFGVSPGKVNLQGYGDGLLRSGSQWIRFQSAATDNKEIVSYIEEQQEEYGYTFPTLTEEEKLEKRKEGVRYLKEQQNKTNPYDEDETSVDSNQIQGAGVDGIVQKDFAGISTKVLEGIRDIEGIENLAGYVNKKLNYMDEPALKMLSYLLDNGELNGKVKNVYPSLSNAEVKKFRNLLIHSGVATPVGMEEDEGYKADNGQPLILESDCQDAPSIFIRLGQYLEKETGKPLNSTN